MSDVSKGKVTAGYVLLLVMLLFSLWFVYREMGKLRYADNREVFRADSLLSMLKEKEENTVRFLNTLNNNKDSVIYARDVKRILAEQDSLFSQQWMQKRVTAHRDTLLSQTKKKGFLRRLGEVFVPPKDDTLRRVRTSLELETDTLLKAYNPVSSLQEKLRTAARPANLKKATVNAQKYAFQRFDDTLRARIDTLLRGYEQETLAQAVAEAEHWKNVRRRSTTIIGGIAAGAILLAIVFLLLIWRDITRSNRYRRELEAANRRAEALLLSREKMMLAITHDFKAPLGSIMGYTDLLSGLAADDRQRFYLDNMKISSEHLLKLVSDLLDFHRLDLHKAEVRHVAFHPSHLLEEVRVSFEPLTRQKGLFLRCEVDSRLEDAFVSDPMRLRQIINNLLSNAVKFTPKGGITLSAALREVSEENEQECWLELSVADTGKGMLPEDRERIFQEFTRLPGAQGEEGFGLGLSIVRMLVSLLGGNIQVESELNKGSVFTVRLPLLPATAETESEGQRVAVAAEIATDTFAALRVLLIDDDRIQLEMTAAMLSRRGIFPVSCMQPDELLDALRTEYFDLLLSDVQMPAMNGFDLLKLLRSSNIPLARTIPVIAVTARSEMRREDFLSYGFAGCLQKPFTVSELLRELNINNGGDSAVVKPAVEGLNFDALTAFSEDDTEATTSILQSFVDETRKNIASMKASSEAKDMDGISRMAHKMLPIFTLLGAVQLVSLLRELEASRATIYTAEAEDKICRVLQMAEEAAACAEKRIRKK